MIKRLRVVTAYDNSLKLKSLETMKITTRLLQYSSHTLQLDQLGDAETRVSHLPLPSEERTP